MNKEEIRAKALEIAVLTYGAKGTQFLNSGDKLVPELLHNRTEAIIAYLEKNGAPETIYRPSKRTP
jgi:hypothetical protein